MIRRSYNGEMLVIENGYANKYRISESRRKDEILRQILMIVGTLIAGVGALALVFLGGD